MKHFNNLILASMLFAPSALWAQNNAAQSSTTAINASLEMTIELDHEEKFPEPVKHALFSKDAAGLLRPRILVTEKAIKILDDSGKLKREIPREDDPAKRTYVNSPKYGKIQAVNTDFYPDEYGKAMAVHITRGHSDRRESWETGEYYILDKDGKETLHLQNFNDDTRPIPSPSGDYAVGWPGCDTPGGAPIFYDANGYRNKWARGWGGEGWPEGYGAQEVRFSQDGKQVAIIASKGGCGGPNPLIIIYDNQGNKLWEKPDVVSAQFSPNGFIVYESKSTGLSLANLRGNVIWTSTTVFHPLAFSKDGAFMVVGAGPAAISVLRVRDGYVVWRWQGEWHYRQEPNGKGSLMQTSNIDFGISAAAITPGGQITVALGRKYGFKYMNSNKTAHRLTVEQEDLFVFDGSGHVLAHKTFPGYTFSIAETLISVLDNERLISVGGNDGAAYLRFYPKVKQ